ncbi:hypothetical protein M5K25_028435 [Dendrobium thyrsiflorum]|uniref:Uncharacterized protein n=1 Tax=Dendrobium thyrsiflorum TaxID=117978 RepID=A0ABD0TTA4_DENTH
MLSSTVEWLEVDGEGRPTTESKWSTSSFIGGGSGESANGFGCVNKREANGGRIRSEVACGSGVRDWKALSEEDKVKEEAADRVL